MESRDISLPNITRRKRISIEESVKINHLYSSLGTRRLHRGGPPSIPVPASATAIEKPPVGVYFDVLYTVTVHI